VARLAVTSPGLEAIPRGEGLARAFDPLVPESAAIEAVRVETIYEVRTGEPFVRLTTRFENTGDEPAPIFAYGDLWMRGGRSMRAFVADALTPESSRGFHHTSFSRSNILSSFDAMARFSHVAMSGLPTWPPITYALFSPERSASGRSFFGVSGEHVTLALSFLADDGWPDFGALRFATGSRAQLEPGEHFVVERRLLVVEQAHVAAATDVILPLLGVASLETGVEGAVEPASVRTVVQVETAAGAPVTSIATDLRGRYRAVLPPGDYALHLRAAGRTPEHRRVRVEEGGFAPVEVLRWPALATLRFAPAFADGGPGRIVIQGLAGTPDPVLEPELLDFRLDGVLAPSASETNALWFVGNASDVPEASLAPGRYALTATRGLEYEAQQAVVALEQPGDVATVEPFDLERVAVLPDHVSADLHVHAQASDDSGTPNEQRLRELVAAGIDLFVATDHDHVADYRSALETLGLGQQIRVVTGVEVTSSTPSFAAPWTVGHHNAWPIAHRPLAHRAGAPESQEFALGELYSNLRREHGVGVVQLNHPRGREAGLEEGSYLTHLGTLGRPADPTRPLSVHPNRALLEPAADGTRPLDFDAIEVMNGNAWDQYRATRQDFLWLLRQGVRRTATANSDSHGPDELAGLPRNYVRIPDDAGRDVATFDSALRAGRSFGTTGPLVTHFSVNGASMGETVGAPGGEVRIAYQVAAASWVPRGEVRLLVNGEVVFVSNEGLGVVPLRLGRDAFVTLEAGVPLDVDPAVWKATHPGLYTEVLAPGFLPAAFTNPVYVDVDGDGNWSAPGLPPTAAHRRQELAWAAAAALALGGVFAGSSHRARRRARAP
jgi:hypothetical protein